MKTFVEEKDYSAQFATFWRATQKEFFKCEAQQAYDESGEEEFLSLFRAGKITELKRMLEDDVKRSDSIWQESLSRGISFLRIHVFSLPLTEYLRFELEAYDVQTGFGEQIWMVPIERLSIQDRAGLKDFMMFDQARALIADYAGSGQLLGATATDEPKDLLELSSLRKRLLEAGIPWNKFWQDYRALRYA